MPPLPKPRDQRRRRNFVPGEKTLPAERTRRPKVPTYPGNLVLNEQAAAYWRAIWTSPMASQYLKADVLPLARLVELVHEWFRPDSEVGWKDIAGEIRQLEDRYGLNEAARRRLHWYVEEGGEKAKPAAKAAPTKGDPRLRVVG